MCLRVIRSNKMYNSYVSSSCYTLGRSRKYIILNVPNVIIAIGTIEIMFLCKYFTPQALLGTQTVPRVLAQILPWRPFHLNYYAIIFEISA